MLPDGPVKLLQRGLDQLSSLEDTLLYVQQTVTCAVSSRVPALMNPHPQGWLLVTLLVTLL